MNSAKKTRPIPAMAAETMALEMTPLSVNTLNLSDAACSPSFDWKLSKFAVGGGFSEVDEEEGIKEGGRVDEIEVGRGVGFENTVLLITEV
jgi:hypothetical protein